MRKEGDGMRVSARGQVNRHEVTAFKLLSLMQAEGAQHAKRGSNIGAGSTT